MTTPKEVLMAIPIGVLLTIHMEVLKATLTKVIMAYPTGVLMTTHGGGPDGHPALDGKTYWVLIATPM